MQYILVVLWPGGFFGGWGWVNDNNFKKLSVLILSVKPVKIYRILPDVTPIPYGHMDRLILYIDACVIWNDCQI